MNMTRSGPRGRAGETMTRREKKKRWITGRNVFLHTRTSKTKSHTHSHSLRITHISRTNWVTIINTRCVLFTWDSEIYDRSQTFMEMTPCWIIWTLVTCGWAVRCPKRYSQLTLNFSSVLKLPNLGWGGRAGRQIKRSPSLDIWVNATMPGTGSDMRLTGVTKESLGGR